MNPTTDQQNDHPAEPQPGRADVLVTGASGFLGSHLTRRLAGEGHRVRVLVREDSDLSGLAGVEAEHVVGSLTDRAALDRAVAGVRHVYNIAGKSADWGAWTQFHQANVEGPRTLAAAAHAAGTVERLVHVSTTDVYGYPARPCDETAPPRDIGLPYNRSKVMGEAAVREEAHKCGLPLTVVRPVSIYGPRSKDFVIEVATLLVKKQMMVVRGGRAPAGLLYVDNAVDALIAACTTPAAAGRTYNLRDSAMTTWREYLDALADGLGAARVRLSLPAPLAYGLAGASELVWRTLRIKARPLLTRHAVYLFERDQSYAIDRAQNELGFKSAVDFEEGMRRTVAWLDSDEGRASVPR